MAIVSLYLCRENEPRDQHRRLLLHRRDGVRVGIQGSGKEKTEFFFGLDRHRCSFAVQAASTPSR